MFLLQKINGLNNPAGINHRSDSHEKTINKILGNALHESDPKVLSNLASSLKTLEKNNPQAAKYLKELEKSPLKVKGTADKPIPINKIRQLVENRLADAILLGADSKVLASLRLDLLELNKKQDENDYIGTVYIKPSDLYNMTKEK